jgi:hypothetical protein
MHVEYITIIKYWEKCCLNNVPPTFKSEPELISIKGTNINYQLFCPFFNVCFKR